MKEISENKIEISDKKEPNKEELNNLEITETSKQMNKKKKEMIN